MRKTLLAVGALLLTGLLSDGAQEPGGPPEKGRYTERQAQRGEVLYQRHCAECHRVDLTPDEPAPGLVGRAFDWRWRNLPVEELFERTRSTMPPDRAGALDSQAYTDIVAYVLRINGFPPGSKELDFEAPDSETSPQATLREFAPVTDQILRSPADGDWLRWRRDHGATGYSPLDRIHRGNVHRLRLAWAWAMESGSQEQEPIVYRGVMFLPHPNNVVQALDARTGTLIWEFRREPPEGRGSTGTTRNIAIYRNKILMATSDAHLVALDARTGKLVWDIEAADHRQRFSYSTGPIVGNGRVFAATTCGGGAPSSCFVGAYDVESGRELWRRESVAGPGDPAEHNATWGGLPYRARTKSSLWLTGSYDPDLGRVYWTTGSAYPYPEILKGTGDGSLLYTNSILALSASTGSLQWFFQMLPRDNFDMDHQDNPILADVTIGAGMRRVVYAIGKPGVLWAFDRITGEHLWNRQLVTYQNLYSRLDPVTGRFSLNEDVIPKQVGASHTVCPGMRGGKLFQTKAYNPVTRAVYVPISNSCTNFEVVPLDTNRSGLRWDRLTHMPDSEGRVGRLAAVSAATGEVLWTHDQRAAFGSALTTAGGLVFVGDLYRFFRAFDARTGEVLWEVPLSGPVTGYPVSYAVEGKQYVAVAVGGGTTGQRHLNQLYPELRAPVGSNVLMVFALDDERHGVGTLPSRNAPSTGSRGSPE